jgi:hypothetical protein
MITAQDCIDAIDIALIKFGTYSYYDKGAHEVMDIDAIEEQMKDMSASQIADVLADVRKHKHGEEFVQTMMCNLDTRDDLNDLYADERVSDLY